MDNNPLPFIALAGRQYKEPQSPQQQGCGYFHQVSNSTGWPGAIPSTPPGALLRGTVLASQDTQAHAPRQQVATLPFSNSRPYHRQPPPSYNQSHAQSQRQRRGDRVPQGTSQTDGARERTQQGRLVCPENNATAPSKLVVADSPLFQLHYHDLPGSRTPRRYFIQARVHRRQATTLQGAIVCEESGCSNSTTELVTGNTNRLQHCPHCYSRYFSHDCDCQLEENRRDRRTEVAQETTNLADVGGRLTFISTVDL